MEEDVISHLKIGPKTADELAKLISTSRKTLYKKIKHLVDEEKVLMLPLLADNHWVSLFALPEHRELAVAISGYSPAGMISAGIESKVAGGIDDLRFKLFRNPDVDEIAVSIGESPEEKSVRDAIYRIGSKLKWRPPTPDERTKANEDRALVLELATWIKKGYLEAMQGKPAALVNRAKEYLKRFPEEVP
jgi:hypothetical protein